jgi:hypothetical protein
VKKGVLNAITIQLSAVLRLAAFSSDMITARTAETYAFFLRAKRRSMAVRIRMTAHVQADLCEWFNLTQLLKSVVVAVEHLLR